MPRAFACLRHRAVPLGETVHPRGVLGRSSVIWLTAWTTLFDGVQRLEVRRRLSNAREPSFIIPNHPTHPECTPLHRVWLSSSRLPPAAMAGCGGEERRRIKEPGEPRTFRRLLRLGGLAQPAWLGDCAPLPRCAGDQGALRDPRARSERMWWCVGGGFCTRVSRTRRPDGLSRRSLVFPT